MSETSSYERMLEALIISHRLFKGEENGDQQDGDMWRLFDELREEYGRG